MHINRGLLFWGVALITAGVVALGASQGLIDTGILAEAWRLWPLILIAIGLSIALSRTSFAWLGSIAAALVVGAAGGVLIAVGPGVAGCSGEAGNPKTSSGAFAGPTATVELELTCGSLDVGMTDGSGWRADTRVEGSRQPALDSDAGRLSIRSGERGLPFDNDRQDWTVQLGHDLAYDFTATVNAADSTIGASAGRFDRMQLTANAGSTQLDVSGASVPDFEAQLNAGSLVVEADQDTDLSGRIGANAGSVDLCAPAAVGLQITVQNSVAFSHNLDDSGLVQSGDTFTSNNFADAAHTIVLTVQGNAASFNLNPDDCANRISDLGS
jgi:hypothetical protein